MKDTGRGIAPDYGLTPWGFGDYFPSGLGGGGFGFSNLWDYFRVMLLTQIGANFISQLIASVSDLTKARIAAENILDVISEPAADIDNLSDEGLRPVGFDLLRIL